MVMIQWSRKYICEVKETSTFNGVKKSKGSIFTHLIEKFAAEQGIAF